MTRQTSLLMVLLLAGCAPAETDLADRQQADSLEAAGPADSGEATATGEAAAERMAAGDTARVTAHVAEFTIRLSRDTLVAGGTAVRIQNEGERPHTIELRSASGMRWRTVPIPPGGTITMSMDLSPGAYTVTSATVAYTERGMRAAFQVR